VHGPGNGAGRAPEGELYGRHWKANGSKARPRLLGSAFKRVCTPRKNRKLKGEFWTQATGVMRSTGLATPSSAPAFSNVATLALLKTGAKHTETEEPV
jgi:hypothetical protein